MKKAILNKFYGVQEIPELEHLEQAEEAGTYAVSGYSRPLNIQPVTDYGAEHIRRQFPQAVFFTGADGRHYFALKCGKFEEEDCNNEIL